MITILQNADFSDRLVLEARDNEELLGTLTAFLENDTIIITNIDTEEFLVDGLCRAALNWALNRGISSCLFKMENNSVLDKLMALGFVKNNNYSIPDIDNFFTFHKNCKKS